MVSKNFTKTLEIVKIIAITILKMSYEDKYHSNL